MEYEISNPSDACAIYADEDIVASVAVLLLGKGRYLIKNQEGKELPTFFAIGNRDIDEAYQEKFGITLGEWAKKPENLIKVAVCLESFKYFDGRSSINNIGLAAASLAKNCRESAGKHNG